jgi:hypothetical protein
MMSISLARVLGFQSLPAQSGLGASPSAPLDPVGLLVQALERTGQNPELERGARVSFDGLRTARRSLPAKLPPLSVKAVTGLVAHLPNPDAQTDHLIALQRAESRIVRWLDRLPLRLG